jgi:phospholipid transport system transporter-binding protein
MNIPVLQRKNHNTYSLSGDLNFDTVPLLWQQSQGILQEREQSLLIFDLEGVTQSDSSGVALLISWTRCLCRQSQTVHFIHFPNQMLAIIQLAGLETILPIIDIEN